LLEFLREPIVCESVRQRVTCERVLDAIAFEPFAEDIIQYPASSIVRCLRVVLRSRIVKILAVPEDIPEAISECGRLRERVGSVESVLGGSGRCLVLGRMEVDGRPEGAK